MTKVYQFGYRISHYPSTRYRNAVILPLLLLLFVAIPAAVVAYGIDPNWAQYPHGFELILFARRFEWPMIALTLVACVAIMGLVISGKRRAWWLIGLAPILTLLGHGFAINPNNAFLINADPIFVPADQASFVAPDDSVLGIVDGPDATAFPFASLYSRPLVVRALRTEPMLLMWSPFANCAAAFRIDRSIQTNELEIVSMPANALLVYNSRIGQFINGITGLTPDGRSPSGFTSRIPTIKTNWARWVKAHPNTTVLAPPDSEAQAPQRAVLPYFPMPADVRDSNPNATVALIASPSSVAVWDSDLGAGPVNFSDPAIVIVRDPATGAPIAFDRHVDEDLVPIFSSRRFRKFPQATMTDSDSATAWTADGRAVDGPLKGKKLRRLEVEDGVYWSVARFWFKNPPVLSPVPVKPASQ
jgi:hypothetical protein